MTVPIESRISSTRAELQETLDAIEDKLNVPKRVSRLARRASESYRANPIPWIAGATAAVIAIGGVIAWAVLTDD